MTLSSSNLLHFTSDFIAGSLSGSAGILAGFPFDTLKVRLQTNNVAAEGVGTGIVANALKIFYNEGPRAFFRGLPFPLITEGARSSIFFGIYGKILGPNVSSETGFDRIFVAGMIGGGIQGVFATPIELIKVSLQASKGVLTYSGSIDCVKKLYIEHGISGVFRGLNATVMREIISFGSYMASYVYLRSWYIKPDEIHPNLLWDLFCGGTAGFISWVVNFPLDTVKSRIQSDDLYNPRYRGVLHCFHQCYMEAGMKVFYRGLLVMCLRAFPVNAVTMVIYSRSLSAMQNYAAAC